MDRESVLTNSYLAGRVERYHTWPTVHRQTVGEHTWQCLRIYWQIFGPPAPEVTTYLIWHDAGELRTGDPPFPQKARNPVLKAAYDTMEHAAVKSMGGPAHAVLPDQERIRCKIVDLLEMHEFGLVEMAMGNTLAQPIVDDTLEAVTQLLRQLPPADEERVDAYVSGGHGRGSSVVR